MTEDNKAIIFTLAAALLVAKRVRSPAIVDSEADHRQAFNEAVAFVTRTVEFDLLPLD